jgi:lauroyl/myristoyl acyltransferase
VAAQKETMQEPNLNDSPRGLISLIDLLLLPGLPFIALVAHIIPHKVWPKFAKWCQTYCQSLMPVKPTDIENCVQHYLRTAPGDHLPEAVSLDFLSNQLLMPFLLTRVLLPFDQTIKCELEGQEYIDAGLHDGKGVIIWDSHFFFANFMTKIVLHRAGYSAVHLSHKRHGFSKSWFGMNVLNRIWVAAETKYLAERVVLSYEEPKLAMNRLAEQLQKNAVVTITVRDTAHHPVEVPFLNHVLRVAPGAPVLAKKTGAQLIPAFTVHQSNGHYKTTLQAPIKISHDADTKTAVRTAVADYARRLEPFVREYPGQWSDWSWLKS